MKCLEKRKRLNKHGSMRLVRTIALAFFLFTILIHAEIRTLTDTQGRQIEARIISKSNEDLVINIRGQEFEVPLISLSEADRTFIKKWEPPVLETPDNPIDAVVSIGSSARGERHYSTGFLAHQSRKTYIYTSQDAISDILELEIRNSSGDLIEFGQLEVSNSQNIARFRIAMSSALTITDSSRLGDNVVAIGTSGTAPIIKRSRGSIQGVTGLKFEINSNLAAGYSGGPVINEDGQVVGVVTRVDNDVSSPDQPKSTMADAWVFSSDWYLYAAGVFPLPEGANQLPSRTNIALKPLRVEDWVVVDRNDYARQIETLVDAWKRYGQCRKVYQLLKRKDFHNVEEGNTWDRELLQIVRSHNALVETPHVDIKFSKSKVNGVSQLLRSKTTSFEEKAKRRRSYLRNLDRYVEDEQKSLRILKANSLEIDFLIKGSYRSAAALENLVIDLRKDIEKAIESEK